MAASRWTDLMVADALNISEHKGVKMRGRFLPRKIQEKKDDD